MHFRIPLFVAVAVVVTFPACNSGPTEDVGTSEQAVKSSPPPASSSGGSQTIETVKVSKAYTNATATGGGQLLIQAASSDANVRLYAYRPDGTLIGEVQNGGGGRYGGTVMPYQTYDPVTVTVTSSSGGTATVPTTPFQI